jgi:hypothetical protein
VYLRASTSATEAGALQMEQAFLDSLWTLINPNQILAVNNAVLYDLLLLMIYNMESNQPLMQTA